MNKRYKRLVLSVSLLAGVGLALWLFVYLRPIRVEVVVAEDHVPVQVFGLGTVEARVLSKVGFEVAGSLIELTADHGDRVAKGTVLARLHSAEQQARVAKAEANVQQARATLNQARVRVARARAVLAQRQQTNRRQQALLKQRTVSQEVVDEAQMNETVAAADLAVAEGEVAVANAAVADAQAQLTLETALLDQHVLVAPYDAVVVARNKELGTVLNSGEALFMLVDPTSIWGLAYVDEARAGELQVGQVAQVRLRSLPRQPIAAHVVRIGIESDRVSEERRVYVRCDQCPEQFYLGEQVEVHITTAVLKRALLVPETAVDLYDGAHGTVWTVESGSLQRRRVAFDHRTLDGRLELSGGLPEDTHVVAVLRPGLREGRWARFDTGQSQ